MIRNNKDDNYIDNGNKITYDDNNNTSDNNKENLNNDINNESENENDDNNDNNKIIVIVLKMRVK